MKRRPTVPCIGWPARPPCPAYDHMLACRWHDGHHSPHECICGETASSMTAIINPYVTPGKRRHTW